MKRTSTLRPILMIALFFPAMAHAANLETIINKLVLYLQGPLAGAAGVLAIVICGYLCFKGVFPKLYFSMVLVGLGLIFGATYYYNWVAG